MIALVAPLMVCSVMLAAVATALLPGDPGVAVVLLMIATGSFLFCATYRGEQKNPET